MRDTRQKKRLRPGKDEVVVATFISAVMATVIVTVAFSVIVAFAVIVPAVVVIATAPPRWQTGPPTGSGEIAKRTETITPYPVPSIVRPRAAGQLEEMWRNSAPERIQKLLT